MFSNQEKTKNGLETASHFQLATIVNHSAAVTFLKTAGSSLRIFEPQRPSAKPPQKAFVFKCAHP